MQRERVVKSPITIYEESTLPVTENSITFKSDQVEHINFIFVETKNAS